MGLTEELEADPGRLRAWEEDAGGPGKKSLTKRGRGICGVRYECQIGRSPIEFWLRWNAGPKDFQNSRAFGSILFDTRHSSELSLLGGFVFSIEGDALLGISAGSQRLLAFLAVRDRVTPRTQVAGTLWPDSTDQHAGASLRSSLSRLDGPSRRAVTVTAADIGLREGVALDVRRSKALARRLIDRDAPQSESDISAPAVSALSDDLLPGWYDDWAVIAAEDWRQLRLHALEAVADRLTAASRLAEAAGAALAAVRAEPLRESSRAALIRVHMEAGNQSEAVGEFERYRILLHAELGLEPTSRIREVLGSLEPR